MIARLWQIERAAPEKRPACRHLLDELLPYVDQAARIAARTPLVPALERG